MSSLDDVKRYPANGEMILDYTTTSLSSNISEMFLNATSRGNFTEARRDIEDLYDKSSLSATSTDLRLTTYYREATAVSSGKTFSFCALYREYCSGYQLAFERYYIDKTA